MLSSITDDFLLLDNTLLLYKGWRKAVTIPYNNDGFIIECIGKAAICDNKNVMQITLENGIREIECKAISGLENLRKITLPDSLETVDQHAFDGLTNLQSIDMSMNMTASEYRQLLSVSCADRDGRRVVTGGLGGFKGTSVFSGGFYLGRNNLIKPALALDSSQRRIYVNEYDVLRAGEYLRTYDFTGGSPRVADSEDILDKINALKNGTYVEYSDTKCELANDNMEKLGKPYYPPQVFIPVFNESEVEEHNGMYRFTLYFHIGTAYFYRVKELHQGGEVYYYAEKCAITGEQVHPYVRFSDGTFYYDDATKVADEKLIKRLRTKFRFLTVI